MTEYLATLLSRLARAAAASFWAMAALLALSGVDPTFQQWGTAKGLAG
jgi:hypothetical protein